MSSPETTIRDIVSSGLRAGWAKGGKKGPAPSVTDENVVDLMAVWLDQQEALRFMKDPGKSSNTKHIDAPTIERISGDLQHIEERLRIRMRQKLEEKLEPVDVTEVMQSVGWFCRRLAELNRFVRSRADGGAYVSEAVVGAARAFQEAMPGLPDSTARRLARACAESVGVDPGKLSGLRSKDSRG